MNVGFNIMPELAQKIRKCVHILMLRTQSTPSQLIVDTDSQFRSIKYREPPKTSSELNMGNVGGHGDSDSDEA